MASFFCVRGGSLFDIKKLYNIITKNNKGAGVHDAEGILQDSSVA